MSIVVPAYRAAATLQACVDSLLRHRTSAVFEVMVCASADSEGELPRLPNDPRLKVLSKVPRLSAAAARNWAVRETRGSAIAFVDADVVVDDGWLDGLVAASGRTRAVAGSVRNGTPNSRVGTAEYLLQFVDLHPGRPAGRLHFGATCNLYLPRDLWESHGPFPEDMDGGEDTLLTAALGAEDRFVFQPAASVSHLNRVEVGAFARHQYEFGRFSARLARRGPGHAGGPLRQTLQRHGALAPFAAAGKVCWVLVRAGSLGRGTLGDAMRSLPLLVLGALAWGGGLMAEGMRERRTGRSRVHNRR